MKKIEQLMAGLTAWFHKVQERWTDSSEFRAARATALVVDAAANFLVTQGAAVRPEGQHDCPSENEARAVQIIRDGMQIQGMTEVSGLLATFRPQIAALPVLLHGLALKNSSPTVREFLTADEHTVARAAAGRMVREELQRGDDHADSAEVTAIKAEIARLRNKMAQARDIGYQIEELDTTRKELAETERLSLQRTKERRGEICHLVNQQVLEDGERLVQEEWSRTAWSTEDAQPELLRHLTVTTRVAAVASALKVILEFCDGSPKSLAGIQAELLALPGNPTNVQVAVVLNLLLHAPHSRPEILVTPEGDAIVARKFLLAQPPAQVDAPVCQERAA